MRATPPTFSAYRAALWALACAFAVLSAVAVLVGDAATLAALLGVGALALAAERLRSRWIAASAVAAAAGLAFASSGAPGLGYRGSLVAEAFAAALPVVALALARAGTHRARLACGVERRVPLAVGSLLVAALATAIRLAEIALLWDAPGTTATVAYALRGDLAETFWAVAAAANAGAYFFAAHASAAGRTRSVRRVVTAAALAVAIFSFVGYDVGTAVAAGAHGPVGLGIGFHTDDLGRLPEGVRLAQLDVAWEAVEPEAGRRNWSAFDEQVRLAEKRGIGLLLIANTYPPGWLARARPEAIMVDQDANPFTWIDEAPGVVRERIWDMSFHDRLVVEAKEDFARAVAERYGASPAVRWVSVQNEPAYPVDWNLVRYASYDNATVAAFRGWLAVRYATLDALNENHSTSYARWAEIEAPRHPLATFWSDWMRFREDGLVSFVEGLTSVVRTATDRPVTVKIMAHFATRFAAPQAGLSDRVVRAFANASDVVSVDLYPATLADLRRSLDYFEDVAAGKPLLVAEYNLLLGTNVPTGGARLVNHILAMDGRVDAVFLFTADDHYLYGLTAHARSPAMTALALLTTSPLDPRYSAATTALLLEDALAVQNLYHVYALGMQAAGLPVVPWPILLLVAAPVPGLDERTRLRLGALRLGGLAVVLLVLAA